jgi:hypothetical protein
VTNDGTPPAIGSPRLDCTARPVHPESVPVDARTLERVRRLLAERDDVEEKPMVGGRSFVVRGQLCCGVTGQGLVVRLGPDGVVRARQEAHVLPLVMGGKEVGAFAVVEPEGYAEDEALGRWVSRALAVVEGLL